MPGVTVLIYDQTCAAEKRRRRKRHTFPDPDKRVIINELVCEGCGDCGVKSNCVSVQPLETEWGRKRTIDQSSCNKDFSCVKGFCPSFVTVHGAKLKKGKGVAADQERAQLPEPKLPAIDQTYNIIVTGVGGTGIVTVGGILGMAAHLEGRGVGVLDMAGLAQKGGAVFSHIRFAAKPEDIHAIRVAAGRADLVIGGDIVVAGTKKVLAAVKHGATQMVINTDEFLPGEFTRNADFSLPSERLKRTITADAGADHTHFVDASRIANALFGQSIGANMFMVGFAYQLGAIPLSAASIEKAIELNGEAVAMNHAAFHWGRRAVIDRAAVEALAKPASSSASDAERLSESISEVVARREKYLEAYQSAAYARRYRTWVDKVIGAETSRAPGKSGLADAVARYLFKLMAYKDEYEVARLYTDGAFAKQIQNTFGGENLRFEFHLAPPILARRDPATGLPRKTSFGPWLMPAFRVLAKLKFLRGTALDPFGRTLERRTERQLIGDYETMLDRSPGAADAGKPPSRRRARRHPGKDPRLRPRQAAPSHCGQGRRSGFTRAIPHRRRKPAQSGRVDASALDFSLEHDLFRKPVPTFRDHALDAVGLQHDLAGLAELLPVGLQAGQHAHLIRDQVFAKPVRIAIAGIVVFLAVRTHLVLRPCG